MTYFSSHSHYSTISQNKIGISNLSSSCTHVLVRRIQVRDDQMI